MLSSICRATACADTWEEAPKPEPPARQLGAGLVIHDALVVLDVAVHDRTPQIGAGHVGILRQRIQETGVGPAERRLGFLRGHRVAGVRRQCAEDFELPHQAGVHPDQLELVQPGLAADVAERRIQIHQVQVAFKRLRERDVAVAAPVGRRIAVAPAARPAHAVVRQDQDILVGRVTLHGPGHEINQGAGIGHVDLAQVTYHLRLHPAEVVVLRHVKTAGPGPVPIALEPAFEPIHLGHDIHAIGGPHALGLVQIDVDVLLQDLVVGVLVEHHRPRLARRCGRADRSLLRLRPTPLRRQWASAVWPWAMLSAARPSARAGLAAPGASGSVGSGCT